MPKNAERLWHPVFPAPNWPRSPTQTEAQYAEEKRIQAEGVKSMGVYLGLFQMVCTSHGHHLTCPVRSCRRMRRCAGRRDPLDPGLLFGVFVPPCVPLEDDVIQPLRDEISAVIHKTLAEMGVDPNAPDG